MYKWHEMVAAIEGPVFIYFFNTYDAALSVSAT